MKRVFCSFLFFLVSFQLYAEERVDLTITMQDVYFECFGVQYNVRVGMGEQNYLRGLILNIYDVYTGDQLIAGRFVKMDADFSAKSTSFFTDDREEFLLSLKHHTRSNKHTAYLRVLTSFIDIYEENLNCYRK